MFHGAIIWLCEFSEKHCKAYYKLDFLHGMFRIHKKKSIEEKRCENLTWWWDTRLHPLKTVLRYPFWRLAFLLECGYHPLRVVEVLKILLCTFRHILWFLRLIHPNLLFWWSKCTVYWCSLFRVEINSWKPGTIETDVFLITWEMTINFS